MGCDWHDTITCKELQNCEINVTLTGQFMSFSFLLSWLTFTWYHWKSTGVFC